MISLLLLQIPMAEICKREEEKISRRRWNEIDPSLPASQNLGKSWNRTNLRKKRDFLGRSQTNPPGFLAGLLTKHKKKPLTTTSLRRVRRLKRFREPNIKLKRSLWRGRGLELPQKSRKTIRLKRRLSPVKRRKEYQKPSYKASAGSLSLYRP